MNLTEHFTLDSLLRSETATEKGYTEQFTPPVSVLNNLTALAKNVLEPLRLKANVPVSISSGYRCPRLNAAVGGEPASQHITGEAADTNAENFTTEQWYQFIKSAGIPFDELIIETNSRGAWWVHVSFDPSKPLQRGICLKGVLQPGGGTVCLADGYGSFMSVFPLSGGGA
jgi:hypothetical protein